MKDLRDTLIIARRELLERVTSKWFALMTLIGPIGMIAMIVIPAAIARSSTEGTKVEIVDRSGALARPLAAELEAERWRVAVAAPETRDSAEEEKIRRSEINGYLAIPPDALAGGTIVYRGDNASSQAINGVLRTRVTKAVLDQRMVEAHLTPEQHAILGKAVSFSAEHTTGEKAASSGGGAFLVAYFLGFILYMVITIYGIGVMRSVVQEKSSRVMELMVAVVKPRSLMAG